MLEHKTSRLNPLQLAWRRMKDGFIQTVPEEIAVCEFDCQKVNCTEEEWRACKRRMQRTLVEVKKVA